MQKSVKRPQLSVFATIVTVTLGATALLFTACAGLRGADNTTTVRVDRSDRLYLTVAPFDAVVGAELVRGGLDPAKVGAEFDSELRYQLARRGQEESLDSAGASVRLRVEVRHLQPGSGNAGNFAVVRLVAIRGVDSSSADWEWRPSARDNAPVAHVVRHITRELAREVVAHLKAGSRKNYAPGMDTPPPLILLK
jgi:hypothetical protein